MRSIVSWSIAGVVSTIVLFTGWNVSGASPLPSEASAKPDACTAPEYRQFDFWIGDWDAFDGDNRVARTHVDRVLNGCVLRESYEGTNGLNGQSFSVYDASRKQWHQSWVTNRGQLLVIEGRAQADAMVLAGSYKSAGGEETLVRGTWKPLKGGVRETAVTSVNAGQTWSPWFDLVFRPRANASSKDDERIVADLDEEYQAAVQRNDAATMQRILSDDFILVTGSGKTYTQADLLEAARSGRVHYGHQQDMEKTVRSWGDTAVVTAKLWEEGTEEGKPFNHTLWFSDTYVRTPKGWRYVFGQASLPQPGQKQ